VATAWPTEASECRAGRASPIEKQYAGLPKVPNGYCPNHSTGVTFPDVEVTPLQYVD
jgi:hypothetical protein